MMDANFPSLRVVTENSEGNWEKGKGGKSFKEMVKGFNESGEMVQYLDDFEPQENDASCLTILLTAEEKRKIRKPWKNAIIIKVLDQTVGFNYLRRSLMQKWKPKGEFAMIDVGNEYYVIRFTNEEDLNHVMMDGPWLIGDNYLTIQ